MPNLCSLLFFVICELCLLLDFCFVKHSMPFPVLLCLLFIQYSHFYLVK